MRRLIFGFVVSFSVLSLWAQDAPKNEAFRYPFTLKLQVDKENYYEENFDEIPYVHENSVYLFPGESFGINLQMEHNEIQNIAYQKDMNKADMEFGFFQKVNTDGSNMMVLVVKNKTKNTIFINALMTRPGKKGVFNTSILPVKPGLSDYESWPYPIVQLMLRNIRMKE